MHGRSSGTLTAARRILTAATAPPCPWWRPPLLRVYLRTQMFYVRRDALHELSDTFLPFRPYAYVFASPGLTTPLHVVPRRLFRRPLSGRTSTTYLPTYLSAYYLYLFVSDATSCMRNVPPPSFSVASSRCTRKFCPFRGQAIYVRIDQVSVSRASKPMNFWASRRMV